MNKQTFKLWSEYGKWVEEENKPSLELYRKELDGSIKRQERFDREYEIELAVCEEKVKAERERVACAKKSMTWWNNFWDAQPRERYICGPSRVPLSLLPTYFPKHIVSVEGFMDWCSKKYGFEPDEVKKL